jgi:hypothetical protein
MPDHPSPVAAELNEARDLCALPDPEQLELIRDDVPNRDAGTAVAISERRGPGRRPGSLNRRNAKFREQILTLAGGVHPALALARCYAMPVDALAAVLGCSKLEAFQCQMRAATEVLPYVESKQPVDVNVNRRSDVVLIMPGGGVASETIDAIARDVSAGLEEGVDWESAEIVDVLPSLSGEPLQDVSPPAAT